MGKKSILLIVVMACMLAITACSTVPVTGRSQITLIPQSSMRSMSFQQYDEFLSSHKVIRNNADARRVKTVGTRIQKAVERYFAQQGMSGQLDGYQWEFNLVQDEAVNAWCMPGGKVVVYSGILPMTGNESGLAVVMGHEIAHAVARHGSERMSQSLVVQMGGIAFSKALAEQPETTRSLWMAAYGLGAQYGMMLPYSRLHEKEADHLGLIFMAMAGYDPRTAVDFWKRMADGSGKGKPPELLSTHPSDKTRIREIRKLLPEALRYYEQ
ncbi:MAG: M48 family metallopeptidase [Thermodesulfobacteriota bacterium]|nr:M48 family metallopeptidase [Thermodesulfobacteriota bacterium]